MCHPRRFPDDLSGRFSGDQETEKTCRFGFHSAGKSAGGFDAGKMMIDL